MIQTLIFNILREIHHYYLQFSPVYDFRYADGLPPLPKPETTKPVAAYEYSREMRTAEELDNLLADPDEMRMQALLIRERILGPAHPDTSYYVR